MRLVPRRKSGCPQAHPRPPPTRRALRYDSRTAVVAQREGDRGMRGRRRGHRRSRPSTATCTSWPAPTTRSCARWSSSRPSARSRSSGRRSGGCSQLLARAIRARRVIELGSGFGYSAYWFARAVGAGGEVVLTEGSRRARGRGARVPAARRARRSRAHRGRRRARDRSSASAASSTSCSTTSTRSTTRACSSRRRRRCGPGGLLISDNMLWFGTVLEPNADGAVDARRAGADAGCSTSRTTSTRCCCRCATA